MALSRHPRPLLEFLRTPVFMFNYFRFLSSFFKNSLNINRRYCIADENPYILPCESTLSFLDDYILKFSNVMFLFRNI